MATRPDAERDLRIAAVVLAAGEGRRMGGPKALLRIQGTTFLARVCAGFAAAGVERTIAVLGAASDEVRRAGEIPDGVVIVVNERWHDGMLSSICRGLDEADAQRADAILVHPVDNPLVSAATVAAVTAAIRSGAPVVVPVHEGRRGHPAGFARSTWSALRTASLARGARQVLVDHPEWVVHVSCGPDCLVDVDVPADLTSLG